MAMNFANRTALSGKLQGTPINIPPFFLFDIFKRFGANTTGSEALGNAALGVYLGKSLSSILNALPDPSSLIGNIEKTQALDVLGNMNQKSPAYKARPLNGIWATAPYLHNGSIPNLEQILTAPELRDKQFYVGSRKFDPDKVGLSTAKDGSRGFLFDTSKVGNSNSGHKHGTALTSNEKRDLIEFLKTL
jgi:hypothetical protein